ncbi:HET-domain-containing protein [Stipitochalara longipes BDJ]|nr:HET-domain-containing protein [Stipitochalara longipes BDJ]
MSSGIEPFRYTPINGTQNEFRLLHLAPRYASIWQYATSLLNPSKPISCALERVSLENHPKYSALSYRWGGISRQILVHDRPFTVTDKLEIALQHLQQDWETLTLWIDAICINQQDTEEKTQQVRQMTDIYRGADQVLIWLGPAADGSDQVMGWLQSTSQVCQKNLEDASSQINVHAIATFANRFKNLDSSFLDGFPGAQYRNLCHREWWSRTWVIQELCVPGKPIFVCGKKMISYHDFSNCDFLLKTCMSLKMKEMYLSGRPNEEPDQLLVLSSGPTPADVMMSFRFLYKGQKGKCTLYSLLRTFCDNPTIDAEDPRDKIFSLLGFVSDKDKLNIRIDYGESYSPRDVYIDTSRALLEQGHLDLLFLRQTGKSPDFPSWVCDWGAKVNGPWGIPPPGVDKPFTASHPSTPQVHIYTTNNGQHIAAIRGKLIDTVSSLAPPTSNVNPDSDDAETINFFVSEARRILGPLSEEHTTAIITGGLEYSGLQDQSRSELYRCRTTSKSTDGLAILEKWILIRRESEELKSLETTQPTDEIETRRNNLQSLTEWLRGMQAGVLAHFLRAVGGNLERRVFCGEKGYKGLVPAEAEVEDLLCIFLGANLPSVVRKVEGGRYRLVGEAYIQGFMDGELMEVAGDPVILELC